MLKELQARRSREQGQGPVWEAWQR
jgi:hypothetical protein